MLTQDQINTLVAAGGALLRAEEAAAWARVLRDLESVNSVAGAGAVAKMMERLKKLW